MSKNATYAVVAPGTHTFRIRYWLRNTSDNPNGPIEGTVSKIVTLNCTAGSIHDITANLNPHDYDGDHYYMWDAQQQYWYGYEWTKNLPAGVGQPTLISWLPGGTTSSNYPKSNTDSRWYHEGSGSPFNATQSCATLPNVNELTWYAAYGEPRWDADELWTTMGHLYQGGMWLKKKSVLQADGHYNSNTAYDGTDWRTTNNSQSWPTSQTLLSAADAGNYFYLPALGYYAGGTLTTAGYIGWYWSSSAKPWDSGHNAYYLDFYNGNVVVTSNYRYDGFRGDWPE